MAVQEAEIRVQEEVDGSKKMNNDVIFVFVVAQKLIVDISVISNSSSSLYSPREGRLCLDTP